MTDELPAKYDSFDHKFGNAATTKIISCTVVISRCPLIVIVITHKLSVMHVSMSRKLGTDAYNAFPALTCQFCVRGHLVLHCACQEQGSAVAE